jgi:hypothetical protein
VASAAVIYYGATLAASLSVLAVPYIVKYPKLSAALVIAVPTVLCALNKKPNEQTSSLAQD